MGSYETTVQNQADISPIKKNVKNEMLREDN